MEIHTVKIKCNVCYAEELTIHDYDGRLFIDPCPCADYEHEHLMDIAITSSYEDGREDANLDFEADYETEIREEEYERGYKQGIKDGKQQYKEWIIRNS